MGQYLQELREARKERLKRFREAELAYQRRLTAISEALLEKGGSVPEIIEEEAKEEREIPDEWSIGIAIKADAKKVPIRAICRETCKHFNVSIVDFLSSRRTGDLVYARQLAAYISKKLTVASLPMIGQTMMRDHTTVLYSVRKVAKMLEDGHNMTKQHIEAIENKIASQYAINPMLSEPGGGQ